MSKFYDQNLPLGEMRSKGLQAENIITDNQIKRVPVAGKKGKPGWYVATEINGKIFAHYGDWTTGEKYAFKNGQEDAYTLTDEERIALDLLAEQERRERARKQEKAAKLSLDVWEAAKPVPEDHPYLQTKGIKAHEARFEEATGALLINLKDRNGNHASIQRIWDESQLQSPDAPGKKLFKYGKKQGCCHVIDGKTDRIFICEGFATGATINEETKCKVLVAIDSGNLLHVAKIAREMFGDWKNAQHIIIAADNDWKKAEEIDPRTGKKKENVGLKKAKEAAEAIGADLIKPEGIEGSDFNDMRNEKGPEATKSALLDEKPQVQSKTFKEIMEATYPDIRWAVEGIIPEGLTILAGRPKFGKSWLMLGLTYAIATGSLAWEYGRTRKGNSYYLALEDSFRRIRDRGLSMEGYINEYPDNMHVFTGFPRIGEGFLREVERIIKNDDKIGVIVVDTLQKIRPKSKGGKRNLYQAEYEDYERLQRLAIHYGIPVIAIHHTRKGGQNGKNSNPMDEMSGSSGIQGVADTLIVCTRDGNQGVMHVTGREVNEEDYPMEFNKRNMTWKLSAPEAHQLDTGPMMLSNWFESNVEITVKEAAEVFDVNERTASRKISKLVEEGKLVVHRNEGPLKFYSPTDIF